MSPLLNYTTQVSAEKTVQEIQAMLAKRGARQITVEYDGNGRPIGLSFLIETPYGPRGFLLPARLEAVFKVLTRQHDQGRVPRRYVTREQAARVGWRILKDWTSAQLALIETGMVELTEVLLPYLQDERTGRSLYETMLERRLALPAGREG